MGPDSVTTTGNENAGDDLGCDPAGGIDCDFDATLGMTISTFLHAADATAPLLGPGPDGAAGPVVGSPTGFNRVTVSGPGGSGSTSDFLVTGRLADGAGAVPLLSAAPVGFGGQTTGAASAVRNVSVRNDGLAGGDDLTVGTPTITGPNAGDFAIAGNGCAAAVPAGASCTIGVRFTAAAAGARSATLNLPSNALTAAGAALAGTGVPPATTVPASRPAIAVVVRTPQSTVQGTQSRALAVSNLALARRISISRVRRRGLRLSMTVAAGTKVVRVAVYGARNGRKRGPALATVFRTPARAALFAVTLRDRALRRRLRAGQYIVEVRPGTSRSALGVTARRAFRVTR